MLLLLLTIVDPIGSMGDCCCEDLTGLVIVTEAREAAPEAEAEAEGVAEAEGAGAGVEERRAAERELLGIGAEAGLWKGMAECLEEEPEETDADVNVEEEVEEEDGAGVSMGSDLDPRTALAYGIRRGSTCGTSTGFGPGIGLAAVLFVFVFCEKMKKRRKAKESKRERGPEGLWVLRGRVCEVAAGVVVVLAGVTEAMGSEDTGSVVC